MRIWSLATSAAYSRNSIVSISTWSRELTLSCFIRYNIDIQIATLLTSSLGLDTKFIYEISISFPGPLSLHLTRPVVCGGAWGGIAPQAFENFFFILAPVYLTKPSNPILNNPPPLRLFSVSFGTVVLQWNTHFNGIRKTVAAQRDIRASER